jgi:hypothetical protein
MNNQRQLTLKIHQLLQDQSKSHLKIAEQLLLLKGTFKTSNHFLEYCESEFGLGKTSTYAYLKVGEHTVLLNRAKVYKLSFYKLCYLSELKDNIIIKIDMKKLEQLSCRELRKYVDRLLTKGTANPIKKDDVQINQHNESHSSLLTKSIVLELQEFKKYFNEKSLPIEAQDEIESFIKWYQKRKKLSTVSAA